MNPPGLNDCEIWSLFKKGDNRALTWIYQKSAVRLYQFGLNFTSDHALIEDTIQDVFSHLINHRKTLGGTDHILFYLMKAFRRELVRKLKADKKLDHPGFQDENRFEVTWSVDQEIVNNEIALQKSRILLKALDNLTSRQKEAIYLRFTRELSYKAIAGIMEISVEASRNLIYNAVKTLREILKKDGNMVFLLFCNFFLKKS